MRSLLGCVRRSSLGAVGQSQVQSLGLGSREPQTGGWRTGSHHPTLPPPPPQVPGPGNHEKGNLVFSCFALNPSLSPSLGQLLGPPHPAPTPTPTPKDSRSGESHGPARILTPHTHLGCPGPSPSPLLGALGHTDGPSHVHPRPGESPPRRGLRALSSPQHWRPLTACPPPQPAPPKLAPAPQVAQDSNA